MSDYTKAIFAIDSHGDLHPLVIREEEGLANSYRFTYKISDLSWIEEYSEDSWMSWEKSKEHDIYLPDNKHLSLHLKGIQYKNLTKLIKLNKIKFSISGFYCIDLLTDSFTDEHFAKSVLISTSSNLQRHLLFEQAKKFIPEMMNIFLCECDFPYDKSDELAEIFHTFCSDDKTPERLSETYGYSGANIYYKKEENVTNIHFSNDRNYFKVKDEAKWNEVFSHLTEYSFCLTTIHYLNCEEIINLIKNIAEKNLASAQRYQDVLCHLNQKVSGF